LGNCHQVFQRAEPKFPALESESEERTKLQVRVPLRGFGDAGGAAACPRREAEGGTKRLSWNHGELRFFSVK